jgi:SAM-dependent methyltransferase
VNAPSNRAPCQDASRVPVCKLCGSSTAFLMERGSYPIVRCSRCSFMFAVLADGYDPSSIYRGNVYFDSGGECGIADYDALWRRRLCHFYLPRLDRIAEFQMRGCLLDIGCAGGHFMLAAQQRGWQVAGVELSSTMRERAMRLTSAPVYASIEEALAAGRSFECITMFDVIEHLRDPLREMQRVTEALVPGGLAAISTPNCDNSRALAGQPINIWFYPPEHICYFGPRTLPECLERAGLTILALEGLEHYCRAIAGDTILPRWLARLLQLMRPGRRLRPGGALGKFLEWKYSDCLDLYQRRDPADLPLTDVLEIYARRCS